MIELAKETEKKVRTKICARKMGRTIYIISNNYSGDKNIIQKLEEIIIRDFKNEGDK